MSLCSFFSLRHSPEISRKTRGNSAEISNMRKELELFKLNGDDKEKERTAQLERIQADRDQQVNFLRNYHVSI